MYLRSLTLRGFKSFASTTTLNFEPGITCVVGPNGSGKSNVVDALSWVMGEQGAKTLRGGKMEDVIFAGTTARAPLGRAEVILTIDNSDGALPIDYTEVTISRTMFRSGGSEYAINGNSVRLLDVQELLSDSGIGREMHVIVGQGQLDSVLQASPETRRHFIEEAAGVLKHRKRKEKALRKLDATDVNLNRLTDLLAELRRQLRPLGRQAEVARKAAIIQSELRDAKARLLADDLVLATVAFEADLADEERLRAQRRELESALDEARIAEANAEQAALAAQPRVSTAQEVWYALSGVAERASSVGAIAAVRLAHAQQAGRDEATGRDPETVLAEAKAARGQEKALLEQVSSRSEKLKEATAKRTEAEARAQEAEQLFAARQRAIADRREGLAKLSGEVNSARSRLDAVDGELERLLASRQSAKVRAEEAQIQFARLETAVAKIAAVEPGLDNEYELAAARLLELEGQMEALVRQEQANLQERAAIEARVEGLRIGLERKDGSSSLLTAAEPLSGLLGSLTALVSVDPGYETAVSAALGSAADAVAVANLDVALTAFDRLKVEDLGRAGMLLSGAQPADSQDWPNLPSWAGWLVDVVHADAEISGAITRLLFKAAVVQDLAAARQLVSLLPDVLAVTRDGDVLSSWFATGGSSAKPSLIQVQAAVDDAEAKRSRIVASGERLAFKRAELDAELASAIADEEAAMGKLHASDADYSAITEELGRWQQTLRTAQSELDRISATMATAESDRAKNEALVVQLEERLRLASVEPDQDEADPAVRDAAVQAAMEARQAEMEARLGLRTLEERARSLGSRAESLERSAEAERQTRERIAVRKAQAEKDAALALAVRAAAEWLGQRIQSAKDAASLERQEAEAQRIAAQSAVVEARQRSRQLAKDFESIVDASHRDELARAEQRMRVTQLSEKAVEELGIDAETLVAEYGPEVPVPSMDEDGEPVPYVREQQEKRLKRANRDLSILGKINPLALEEFEAMQERHAFLSEQLTDLKKTRADLLSIIKDVDTRVEQVFAEAYTDIAVEFESAFERLFPGGEGRLILTDPENWLTTGVDVEARPAGKKVKRLSLLSGGERALVAVAFLVALFKARPSPFYILDEVEAALDDTNLGRLLQIYEELRDTSQLLVITHQKRTMEIADALYGITMRSDGVSAVISQRLRDE